jgi:hypothetical protein
MNRPEILQGLLTSFFRVRFYGITNRIRVRYTARKSLLKTWCRACTVCEFRGRSRWKKHKFHHMCWFGFVHSVWSNGWFSAQWYVMYPEDKSSPVIQYQHQTQHFLSKFTQKPVACYCRRKARKENRKKERDGKKQNLSHWLSSVCFSFTSKPLGKYAKKFQPSSFSK